VPIEVQNREDQEVDLVTISCNDSFGGAAPGCLSLMAAG
jgi:hypothetical protein